jgi:hypothetical protein
MSKTFNSSSTGSSSKPTRRFPDGWVGPADMPFCKVCYDAGLPVADYTDHFVKDQPGPGGKVVCPTLLNQNCRICKKPGHTSTYCSQYRRRDDRRDEPTRYIEREQPRRDDRRDVPTRYIEREQPRRDDRRDDRRDLSFNRLREDTERQEREIQVRDKTYQREQDIRSKPWLQAALVKTPFEHRAPYAHPHGPRVRIELESRALSSSATVDAVAAPVQLPAVINVMKADLHHATNWCDEEPQQMADEMFLELARENCRTEQYISKEDDDLITMSLDGGHIQFAGYD